MFADTGITFIDNSEYKTTNMFCSLMCARDVLENAVSSSEDVVLSYGDILFEKSVFIKLLDSDATSSVVVDDGWFIYWSVRCEDSLDDAETLMIDSEDYLEEIGQKTMDINCVQSQYIGLMRFDVEGMKNLLAAITGNTCDYLYYFHV